MLHLIVIKDKLCYHRSPSPLKFGARDKRFEDQKFEDQKFEDQKLEDELGCDCAVVRMQDP